MLRVICGGAALACIPLCFARRFSTILPAYFVYASFYIGMSGLTDSLAIARMQAGVDYGRMRVWGSAGCMAAALVTGVLLTLHGSGGADPLVPFLMFVALTIGGDRVAAAHRHG